MSFSVISKISPGKAWRLTGRRKKHQVDLFEAKGQVKEALEEYAVLYFISDRTEYEEILRKVSVLLGKDNSLMEMTEETRKFFLRGEAMRGGKF